MLERIGYFIVPAYNEGSHIGSVVQQATKILPTLVVDDGSKDNTSSIARENGAQVFVLMDSTMFWKLPILFHFLSKMTWI